MHFGSLVAALGSWLDARSRDGVWLVRMEDLDRPRTVRGAADAILRTLEACGLEWDGEVMSQSRRTEAYEEAFARLKTAGCLFPCACTRKEIADSSLRRGAERIYPGTCRAGLGPGRHPRAWRVRVDSREIVIEDAIQGSIRQRLDKDVGDFVVKRADGLFAYQLAVVVDDADQRISHVVRGADLLHSTPRQVYLQRLLSLPQPCYAHLPAAVNEEGEKLSKQTHAPAIDNTAPETAIAAALRFLHHEPPNALTGAPCKELLAWSRAHWQLQRVPKAISLPAAQFTGIARRA